MHSPLKKTQFGARMLLVALPLAAALTMGCAAGDAGSSTGTGGSGQAASGGASATGSGGSNPSGSGGAVPTGSGGASTPGTGGATGSGSGGRSASGTGGSSETASGGTTASGTGGNSATGGASGAPDGGTDASRPDGSGSGNDAATADATVPTPDAGGGTFNPCPAKGTVCAVMPLGDSITEGYRSSGGGYRPPLFHLTLQDKKSITFVGSAPENGPNTVDGVTFPKKNEGVGGRRISSISQLIPSTLNDNKPHIILLMIGTNDLSSGQSSMTSQLGSLLDKILNASPNALLVLSTIIPTKTDSTNTTVKAYNDSMPALVKARADAGKHIVLVDAYTKFVGTANYKSTLMSDELHPKDAGYSVLADIWYPAFKAYLP